MVVPITENDPRPVNLSEIKKFVGNNLQLKFKENTRTIIVIGNNCSIKVSSNFGVIKVIGNNCVVDILKCHGFLEYTGNNGKISIDRNGKPDAVTYNGNNGKITSSKWKSESEDCIPTATKSSNEGKVNSLDILIRSNKVNRTVFVKDNVKISNGRIKINTIDLNSIFCSGIIVQ